MDKEYNKEFIDWLEDQISLCSLAITACGTDKGSAYVHHIYRNSFRKKADELKQETNG